jgi:hypothetical protein
MKTFAAMAQHAKCSKQHLPEARPALLELSVLLLPARLEAAASLFAIRETTSRVLTEACAKLERGGRSEELHAQRARKALAAANQTLKHGEAYNLNYIEHRT